MTTRSTAKAIVATAIVSALTLGAAVTPAFASVAQPVAVNLCYNGLGRSLESIALEWFGITGEHIWCVHHEMDVKYDWHKCEKLWLEEERWFDEELGEWTGGRTYVAVIDVKTGAVYESYINEYEE